LNSFSEININSPANESTRSNGARELRGIKQVIQGTFPLVDKPVTATEEDFNRARGFVVGMIFPFSGNNIPAQWALCDGTNGTPDLRDLFVEGALDPVTPAKRPVVDKEYNIRDYIKTSDHRLTLEEMPAHRHSGIVGHLDVGGGDGGLQAYGREPTGSSSGSIGNSLEHNHNTGSIKKPDVTDNPPPRPTRKAKKPGEKVFGPRGPVVNNDKEPITERPLAKYYFLKYIMYVGRESDV